MPSSLAGGGITPQVYRLAQIWRRAAIALAEEELAMLKAPLIDPTASPADFAAIRQHTQRLAQLEQLEGDELVREFESWRRDHPELTRIILRAIAARDRASLYALWRRGERALEAHR
jgi:hypothetical protein